MYTYEIIAGGYRILRDGAVLIMQPHYPNGDPSVPIADADREPLAQAAIADLTAPAGEA